VGKSKNMNWYNGSTLMYLLENIHIASDLNHIDCRFPVQYVVRPQTDKYHDYRGYTGKIASGIFKSGDKITVLPSGFNSTIKSIDFFDKQLEEAFAPQSVTITLKDDIDVSRGDMIVREGNLPNIDQNIDLMVCWLNVKPLQLNAKYILKHTSKNVRCVVKEIKYKIDINTFHKNEKDKKITMNDIGRISLRTAQPLFFDSYKKNRSTGSLILIDEATNETVAACMIN
jgi:sulfate adenylyltransferase subunit 1